MASAVFSASLSQLHEVLPNPLVPIQVGPGRGAVTLFAAAYEDAGPLEPYHEFAVLPLARPDTKIESDFGSISLTELKALQSFLGTPTRIHAYVHMMPVTTAEARALGTEVWGYPKQLADISIQNTDQQTRTTVSVEGEQVISFTVNSARTRNREVDLIAYSETNERVQAGRIQTYGEYAFRPLANRASYRLGDHPRAGVIRGLRLGSRPLLTVFAPNLRSRYYRGKAVSASV